MTTQIRLWLPPGVSDELFSQSVADSYANTGKMPGRKNLFSPRNKHTETAMQHVKPERLIKARQKIA
ncbi:hypothetical protein [Alkalimonas amylolytica]|uniref:hypothetical protein n=1 Tax=Alkalimonas amylolytica TaxID=152573 RepID=UPI001114956F|nr:hypothetical protein [Alkalimonas amylolytica]